MQDSEKENWQLVHRFYLFDTITGYNINYKEEFLNTNRYEKIFTTLTYASNIEINIQIDNDNSINGNKILIPIVKIEYTFINLTKNIDNTQLMNLDFKFSIIQTKNYSFEFLLEVNLMFFNYYNIIIIIYISLQILLPIFIIFAFMLSLFQAFCYKIRENKLYFDIDIFIKFLIYLFSNISNALFLIVCIICVYTFIIYKTQNIVKILLPTNNEEMIEIFIVIALILKVFIFIIKIYIYIYYDLLINL